MRHGVVFSRPSRQPYPQDMIANIESFWTSPAGNRRLLIIVAKEQEDVLGPEPVTEWRPPQDFDGQPTQELQNRRLRPLFGPLRKIDGALPRAKQYSRDQVHSTDSGTLEKERSSP